jgi:hypothetical protein
LKALSSYLEAAVDANFSDETDDFGDVDSLIAELQRSTNGKDSAEFSPSDEQIENSSHDFEGTNESSLPTHMQETPRSGKKIAGVQLTQKAVGHLQPLSVETSATTGKVATGSEVKVSKGTAGIVDSEAKRKKLKKDKVDANKPSNRVALVTTKSQPAGKPEKPSRGSESRSDHKPAPTVHRVKNSGGIADLKQMQEALRHDTDQRVARREFVERGNDLAGVELSEPPKNSDIKRKEIRSIYLQEYDWKTARITKKPANRWEVGRHALLHSDLVRDEILTNNPNDLLLYNVANSLVCDSNDSIDWNHHGWRHAQTLRGEQAAFIEAANDLLDSMVDQKSNGRNLRQLHIDFSALCNKFALSICEESGYYRKKRT